MTAPGREATGTGIPATTGSPKAHMTIGATDGADAERNGLIRSPFGGRAGRERR